MDWTKLIGVTGTVVVMIMGLWLVFKRLKEKEQGFGPNSLKAIGTVLFIPSLVILALVSQFSTETLAALLGTIAGYVLSQSKADEEK